jgi:hypothetical protein
MTNWTGPLPKHRKWRERKKGRQDRAFEVREREREREKERERKSESERVN